MLETDGEQGPNDAGNDDSAEGPAVRSPRITTIAPTSDLIVLAGAVLLCIAFAPAFVSAPYSPRFAILLGFLPVGLVALGALCLRRDKAAIAASAFVVVGVVSALLSDHVRISLIGQMGKEASALLMAAFLGWWAIGRHLTERGRSLLPYALLIGLAANAVIAILQVAFDMGNDSEFGIAAGTRASGLTASPVQLGALMAGGVAITTTLGVASRGNRLAFWVGATILFSAAADLSGSRMAVVAIAVVLISLLVVHRSARVLVQFGAVILGVVLSRLVDATGGASSTSRLDAQGSDRLDGWRYGLKSFLDRPILGYGPGGFRPAVQSRFSAEFVRTSIYDEQHSAWFDAHNVAIEYLVATGLVGLVLLCVFAWFALRKARGPLLAAFVAIAISWSMQPLSVSTAPVALLALGAAVPAAAALTATSNAERRRRPSHSAFAAAGVIGLVLACGYAFIDLRLDAAISGGDGNEIEAAARWFPRDAVVADLVAQGWANAYLFDGADKSHLILWSAKPADREPDRPYWWSKKAGTQLAFNDVDGARESLDRAIALQPWSPTAWPLMLALAEKTDDSELHALALAKVCELQLEACPDTED